MQRDFTAWLGQSAVLQIRFGDSRLPAYGRIVDVSEQNIRFRVADCLDLDVPREWIEGVSFDSVSERVMREMREASVPNDRG